TARPRWPGSGSTTGSTTCPPAVAPPSSSSSRATCPACKPSERRPMPKAERRPLISGNWKMHHNHLEAIQVVQKLSYRLEKDDYEAVDVSVHPAFTALRSIQLLIDDQRIPVALGAQNCHCDPKGAMTGEISVPMLAKLD